MSSGGELVLNAVGQALLVPLSLVYIKEGGAGSKGIELGSVVLDGSKLV